MKLKARGIVVGVISIFVLMTAFSIRPKDNQLSKKEKKAGWKLLFDGKSTAGWRTYNNKPGSWQVVDGELYCPTGTNEHADLITNDTYDNFELSIDWKIAKAANSGIMYHVLELRPSAYETGPEYQLIDDEGYGEKLEIWQKSGADYAMHAPLKLAAHPVGQYNHTKIIFDRGKVQHWLNGVKVVEFVAGSPEWENLRKTGKWKDYPHYAQSATGHIALQDHGGGVWFKNIKIRPL